MSWIAVLPQKLLISHTLILRWRRKAMICWDRPVRSLKATPIGFAMLIAVKLALVEISFAGQDVIMPSALSDKPTAVASRSITWEEYHDYALSLERDLKSVVGDNGCAESVAVPAIASSDTIYLLYINWDGIQKTAVIELHNGRFDAFFSKDVNRFPIEALGTLEDETHLQSGHRNKIEMTFSYKDEGKIVLDMQDDGTQAKAVFTEIPNIVSLLPGLFVGYGCEAKSYLLCGAILSRTPNIFSPELNRYMQINRCQPISISGRQH